MAQSEPRTILGYRVGSIKAQKLQVWTLVRLRQATSTHRTHHISWHSIKAQKWMWVISRRRIRRTLALSGSSQMLRRRIRATSQRLFRARRSMWATSPLRTRLIILRGWNTLISTRRTLRCWRITLRVVLHLSISRHRRLARVLLLTRLFIAFGMGRVSSLG